MYRNLDKQFPEDWLIEVRKGTIPGHELYHVKARNIDVDTTEEHIWYNGGDLVWQTVAAQMDIVSDNTNDTSAGTGARNIKIVGLDANFDEVEAEYAMNGTTIVTTTESFIRINFVEIIDCGTYGGSNIGDITLQVTGGGDIQANIQGGVGETQKSQYTVPSGFTAYLLGIDLVPLPSKTVTFRLKKRERADIIAAPFSPVVREHTWDGIDSFTDEGFVAGHAYGEKADIWVTAEGEANNNQVSIEYDLLIIDNNFLP